MACFRQGFSLEQMPAVGIIPLGTGNDLARSLGWGPALTETAQLSTYVRRAQLAEVKQVDQWKLTLQAPVDLVPLSLIAYIFLA